MFLINSPLSCYSWKQKTILIIRFVFGSKYATKDEVKTARMRTNEPIINLLTKQSNESLESDKVEMNNKNVINNKEHGEHLISNSKVRLLTLEL